MAGTVYILGAGSSRAATEGKAGLPMPLAADFFQEGYLKEHWYDLSFGGSFKDSALNFVLSRYFSSSTTTEEGGSEISRINVEEVYSFLHSYELVFRATTYRPEDFETARRQLLKYLITVIRYTSWRLSDLGFLSALVRSLSNDDSIITFNWDTLLEQALERSENSICKELLERHFRLIENNYSTGFSTWDGRYQRFHEGHLIKVHGSVNYSCCVNSGCRRSQLPYIWELKEESPEFWPCVECGSPCQVMILPPHGAKTYSAGNFFRLQATRAAEKLSLADQIVLIGYSVPVFDIEARSMLRCARAESDEVTANLERVVIVDPQVAKPEYVVSIKNLLGIDNVLAHGYDVELVTYSNVESYVQAELTQ